MKKTFYSSSQLLEWVFSVKRFELLFRKKFEMILLRARVSECWFCYGHNNRYNFCSRAFTESIKVYPNPANQKLFVRGYPLLVNEITITDVLGRNCILPITNNNNPITEINISKLSPGVYTLTIRNKNGTWIKKVVKE